MKYENEVGNVNVIKLKVNNNNGNDIFMNIPAHFSHFSELLENNINLEYI